jgi:hypothetical protein
MSWCYFMGHTRHTVSSRKTRWAVRSLPIWMHPELFSIDW